MNLADPELELIDPTPNIYSLFMNFDNLFFACKLNTRGVTVRWSKRMYSCAGVCTYEGRSGFCDIALSEPLLKLRPRKNLVETLLHEMIHAFLFVTGRDTDRDGHGPKFRAHMHRINKEAGVNITIYHDFIDEVRLYQIHVWRCNGPCQHLKPYFGIVRRSSNRAPGPSDYWWSCHKKKCGGTFIKTKEPEKKRKKSPTPKPIAKPMGDITKYINSDNNRTNNPTTSKSVESPIRKPIIPLFEGKGHVIGSAMNKNMKPMGDITKYINSDKNKTNNSATPKNIESPIRKPIIPLFEGKGHVIVSSRERSQTVTVNAVEAVRNVWVNKQLSPSSTINTKVIENIADKVREVWANKQLPGNVNITNKKRKAVSPTVPPIKIKRIDDYFKVKASEMLKDIYGKEFKVGQSTSSNKIVAIPKSEPTLVNCNMSKSMLGDCIKSEPNSNKIAAIPKSESVSFNDSESKPKLVDSIKSEPNDYNIVDCPICAKKVEIKMINRHIDECLNEQEVSKTNKQKTSTSVPTVTIDPPKPIKKEDEYEDMALIEIVDRISKKYEQPQTSLLLPKCEEVLEITVQKCPCCGKLIDNSMEEHMEQCLAFFGNDAELPQEGASTSNLNTSTIIITDDDDDELDESQSYNPSGTKAPCPVCLKMYEQDDMNRHLDECLS